MRAANFKKDLLRGNVGEMLFKKRYPKWEFNNKKRVTNIDFVHPGTKETCEVKFDESPRAALDERGYQKNFFMETTSNASTNTVGGIYQAKQKGAKYLCYIFKKPERYYIIDVNKGCDLLKTLISTGKYRECRIKNHSWDGGYYYTIGYPIPISAFKSCLLSENVLLKNIDS